MKSRRNLRNCIYPLKRSSDGFLGSDPVKLGALFEDIAVLEKAHWHPHFKAGRITSDSRLVAPGDIFVACRGARMDGHDFISQAIQSKAAVVVYEEWPDITAPSHLIAVRVADSNECLSQLLRAYYGHPDQKIKLVGVTGTNGKTTIAYLLHLLLREHIRAAYLGTLWYDLPHQKMPAVNTTPGSEVLFPLLHSMVEEKVQACVMEVSSHALAQKRVYGLGFELAIFTQLTQDHLDYHRTLEDYFQAKKMLFDQAPRPRHMLVNIDCPYGKRLCGSYPKAKTISLHAKADYSLKDLDISFHGSRFVFCFKGREVPFQIRLPFIHNIYNVAEVLAALDILGYDPEDFRGSLQEVPGIPGRMERVTGVEGFQVFVDYAHTPDAFENVLSQTRKLNPPRILTVFGCGGDRDKTKRPMMGKIAAHYSDVLVVTSDNPRSEDPEDIIHDILKGIRRPNHSEGPEIHTVTDRREAIAKTLSLARPNDVILILGKGHEDYQILGDVKVSFDDRKVVQECLKKDQRVFFS